VTTLVCLASFCIGILAGAAVGLAALHIDLPHNWALGLASVTAGVVALIAGMAGLDLAGVM
jgi:hypothetical protein